MKFIAWSEGDPTVGDGTYNAELDLPDTILPDGFEQYVKDDLRRMLANVWDTRASRVHVMTEAEHKAWQERET